MVPQLFLHSFDKNARFTFSVGNITCVVNTSMSKTNWIDDTKYNI